ncbi:MAG TPA: recombinase family protein, partial [Gemmataceae bacterium]|nr:recombinase family protein [Gemmataceae bacterium]
MSNKKPSHSTAAVKTVRCAIYTRKSTEERTEQEFTSLQAQREAGEAYIKSQASEGWICLPEHYDDGGFSGGDMDRPALARLLADIEAAKIDAVITYKVDRFSRSLLDFAKMMVIFERRQVAFVSVTQQFNTATSMGRLILNVLLSFAQFEREIISERTRDKIAAARRKGKWSGGHPLLGYDVDPHTRKLLVNEAEAARVREIFQLYLEHQALMPVLAELERCGWRNKRWQTRKGQARGGRPFTKPRLYELLRNVVYVGKVRYKQEVHPGEHAAIVDPVLWQQVQDLLSAHGSGSSRLGRRSSGALLGGLLRCQPCGCAMTPAQTARNGGKRYRYYVCTAAQRQGWGNCPSKALPAAAVEDFVIEQLRALAADAAAWFKALGSTLAQQRLLLADKEGEARTLDQELARLRAAQRKASPAERVALQTPKRRAKERRATLRQEINSLKRGPGSDSDRVETLAVLRNEVAT